MLEPCDAKVSSTVLRGPGDRKVARLLGNPGVISPPPRYAFIKQMFRFDMTMARAARAFIH